MNLPTSRAEQLRAAHGLEAELTQSLGRAPTLGELADALGRSVDWTAGLLAHQRPRSLELVDGSTLPAARSSAVQRQLRDASMACNRAVGCCN